MLLLYLSSLSLSLVSALPSGPFGVPPQDAPKVCRDSDKCCRWNIFPQWTDDFRRKGQTPTAYSFSSYRVAQHNSWNVLFFYCADSRGELRPKGETLVRGPYVVHCDGLLDTVQKWPVIGALGRQGRQVDFYRSKCVTARSNVEYERNREVFQVSAGSKICHPIKIAGRGNVLTVNTSALENYPDLRDNYISITKIPDNQDPNGVYPQNEALFISGMSAHVDPTKSYVVCIENVEANHGARQPAVVTLAMTMISDLGSWP